jgi:tetratricopeptide (TPR) repeat protein
VSVADHRRLSARGPWSGGGREDRAEWQAWPANVRIGILGPLEVRVGFAEPVEVVGPRLRRLLVRLALDPDRMVLASQLVDAVWGEEPPAATANALQSLASRLRRLLPDLIESHPAGYRLALDPEAVDAVRFENLALAGREELRRDPRRAASTLREALALWRGPPLADAAEADFAMLETVRAYGEERRWDAGEGGALRRAHAGYFLELAEQAEPQLRRRDQLKWIGRLSAERDNLHASLRWAIDSQDVTLALRLVGGLGWYWFLRSARAEASEWTEKALALPGEASPTARAAALFVRASIALTGGSEMARSLEYVDEALEIVRGLPVQEKRALHSMLASLPIMAAIFHNEDLLALERARELLEHPDPWIRAFSHATAGGLLVNLGEATAAAAEMDVALAGFRELGERWGIGNVLIARAELSATRGQHDAAVAALEEAREVFVGLGDREDVSQIMIRLAGERARVGELEQAREDLAVADRIAHEVGAEDQKFFVRHSLSDVARWQGRLDEARELADQAMALFERGSVPVFQRQALLLTSRGRVDLAAGDPQGARQWYEHALALALSSRDRPVIARAVELLADIVLVGGDAEQAATLLGTAEVLRGMAEEADVDVVRMRAAAQAALGKEGFAQAYRRGAARPRDEVLAGLSEEVRSAAGTPAAPAGRTPPR